jgi:hypothetical protein
VQVGGGQLIYQGFSFDFAPGASSVQPGGYVPVVLRWSFPDPQAAGLFGIRWSLVTEAGAPVADAGGVAPLFGGRPLRAWERPGESWDYQDLRLPSNLAPGRYRVAIEVVDMQRPDTPLAPGKIALGWVDVR